jgi:hypothetical protein
VTANIDFQGEDAVEMEAAFNYLYSNSTSFKQEFDDYFSVPGRPPVIVTSDPVNTLPGQSQIDLKGLAATAPGATWVYEGTRYIVINYNVNANIVIAGTPGEWVDLRGQPLSNAEFTEVYQDVGYLDSSTFFPNEASFWVNNGSRIQGFDTWSQLPGNDYYMKWAYYEGNFAAQGISYSQFTSSFSYVGAWEETPAALAALLDLRSQSLINREMTLEERIGHEFGHSFFPGKFLDSEAGVIEFMNLVRADLGLPPLREIPANDTAVLDLFSTLVQNGYSIPTVIQILQEIGADCFLAGTPVLLFDGSSKSIERIQVGDKVLSYDASGTLVPGRVTRTFRNEVSHLLDVHGLKVTPGHATLCGDGMFKGCHVPIIDILLSDGALVQADGTLIRMAINAPVGSRADAFVKVAVAATPEDMQGDTLAEAEMRVGTLLFDREGVPISVLDCLTAEGYAFDPETGLIAKPGEAPHPLFWFGRLPRPEDYILTRSRETLEGILVDGEWEGSRSALIMGRLRRTIEGRVH